MWDGPRTMNMYHGHCTNKSLPKQTNMILTRNTDKEISGQLRKAELMRADSHIEDNIINSSNSIKIYNVVRDILTEAKKEKDANTAPMVICA